MLELKSILWVTSTLKLRKSLVGLLKRSMWTLLHVYNYIAFQIWAILTFLLFIGMEQNFSFSIDILWLCALSTLCPATMTLLTATLLMSSFEVGISVTTTLAEMLHGLWFQWHGNSICGILIQMKTYVFFDFSLLAQNCKMFVILFRYLRSFDILPPIRFSCRRKRANHVQLNSTTRDNLSRPEGVVFRCLRSFYILPPLFHNVSLFSKLN